MSAFIPQKKQFKTEQHDRDVELGAASDHNFYSGFATPLEDGGVFVATYQLREVGQRLRMRLVMPGTDETLEVKVEVRWVRAFQPGSDTPPGFGAAFLELDERAKKLIADYVWHRAPIFYAD